MQQGSRQRGQEDGRGQEIGHEKPHRIVRSLAEISDETDTFPEFDFQGTGAARRSQMDDFGRGVEPDGAPGLTHPPTEVHVFDIKEIPFIEAPHRGEICTFHGKARA